jgi:hypothetical protein
MRFYLCEDSSYCTAPFVGANKHWWIGSIYVKLISEEYYWSLLQKNLVLTPYNYPFYGSYCVIKRVKPLVVKRVL